MTRSSSKVADRAAKREKLLRISERGLDHCRRGRWKEGLVDLAWLAKGKTLPGLSSPCYSYLGFGIARYQGKVDNGIRLCRLAIKLEFYQTENYINLARTALLAPRYRRVACDAVREGLEIDPGNRDLLEIQAQLGQRRPPMLPFLARDHPLNRLLGSLRHLFSRSAVEVPSQTDRSRSTLGVTTTALVHWQR